MEFTATQRLSSTSSRRQPCLDFIDKRLYKYHGAFANPHVRFNTSLGRYTPIPRGSASEGNGNGNVMKQRKEDKDKDEDNGLPALLPGQRLASDSAPDPARRPFWEEMLPEAMEELIAVREEPSKLVGTPRSIRGLEDWAEIVNVLELARAKYYNYKGFVGFWRKTGHYIADRAGIGKNLLSLIPDMEYTSLFHCVFDVIFDAAKRTADIREEVEASLRQFREKLEDVERVVAVFADEEEVITAALNVLVSVLQAIEDIIYYYSEKKGPKMGMALLERDEYKADLSECLLGIESSSKRLIEKATIVNFREMHAVDIKTSEGLEKLKELQLGQLKMLKEQKRLADAQSQMNEAGQKIANEQRSLARGLSREASSNERNAAANEMNAAVNMKNAMISAAALNAFYKLSQEYLSAMNEKERLRRLNTHLRARNSRLSSDLTAERSRSRRSSPVPDPISQDQLLDMLNMPDTDEVDMTYISDSVVLVHRRDQGQAEQLVADPQFRRWMVHTKSAELLVHGHMKPSRTNVSALSLFSAAIVRNLRRVDRFRAVAFFCGQHSDQEDPLAGGIGLIKSLVTQLLLQHGFGSADLDRVAGEVDLPLLESGVEDIDELCRLFTSLVRRLPGNITLFCVLDGVNEYEDTEFMHDMQVEKALYEILSLTRDSRVRTNVKILLTSPTDTDTIRAGFDEKDILTMLRQPRMNRHFDDDNFAQQVEGALDY